METAAATVDRDVCSKSEFARRRRVSPARVTQWIDEGKIAGAAIVGEGRGAQIRESVAVAQLRTRLDIDQRLANGLETNLAPPTPQPAALQAPAAPQIAPASPSDQVEEAIKKARLEAIQFDNRKKAEDEARRSGVLTNSDLARSEMGRLAVQIVNLFEGSLPELASALAAKFQVPQRDALHLLRTEMRKVRASAASLVRKQAAEMPETTEFEIEETPTTS